MARLRRQYELLQQIALDVIVLWRLGEVEPLDAHGPDDLQQ